MSNSLQQIYMIYKTVDDIINNTFFDWKKTIVPTFRVRNITIPYNEKKEIIIYTQRWLEEANYFSSLRSKKEILQYYSDHYLSYCKIYGVNNIENGIEDINEDIISSVNDNKVRLWDFINEIKTYAKIEWFHFDKLREIWETKETIAKYNSTEKKIYIHPWVSDTSRRMYIILHELMHHIHYSAINESNFIWDYDYWWGYREWIAIFLSEIFVKKYFTSLWWEHINYLSMIQERWQLIQWIFTKWYTQKKFVERLAPYWISLQWAISQYVSWIRYPWYKESYYPYYKAVKKSVIEWIQINTFLKKSHENIEDILNTNS